eukprot:TRINITY_DN194_c0_g1_i2.p1 TRINITY_DN194_c0_g1~~TRINITY_DN194_c0_g1_i2.p1  ORF type:complete len:498 (-),score=186.81 TRINITY_DN194_c0_g1_i2:283-1662(-)
MLKFSTLFLLALSMAVIYSADFRRFDEGHRVIARDPFLILMGDQKQQPSTIDSTEVDSLITYLTGVLPLHESTRENFPPTSLFQKPKANVLFLFEGFGTDFVQNNENLRVMGLKVFNSPKKVISIQQRYTSSPLSLLNSLVTGVEYHQHGVLDAYWRDRQGDLVYAFTNNETEALRPNIADVLLETQSGKSLIFTAAADKQTVGSLSPHSSLLTQVPPSNTFSYSWNGNQFAPLNSDATRFSFTKENLVARFQNANLIPLSDGGKLEYKEGVFVVTLPSGLTVDFDTSDENTFKFFAEVFYFGHVLHQLEGPAYSSLISDNVVDFYSFGFSSFKAFSQSGLSSNKNLAAVFLLDAVISQLYNKIQHLYGGRAVSEVVSLGSTYSTYEMPISAKFAMQSNGTNSSNNTGGGGDVTVEDVAVYQTCLWTGIILFLAVLSAIYSLVCMPIYADPIIYRPTFK